MPDRLSDADKEYLRQLRMQTTRSPATTIATSSRLTVRSSGKDRSLRAKWERFIFGRPIECTDFLEGLLRALERLYGQAGALGADRSLEIRTARRTKTQWLELNADVATAFAVRYRGLPALMGGEVKWDTSHLFEYAGSSRSRVETKGYKRNVSMSRTSLQIKFDITLKIGDGALRTERRCSLIWMGRPDAIGLELRDDLDRLAQRPLDAVERRAPARQPKGRRCNQFP